MIRTTKENVVRHNMMFQAYLSLIHSFGWRTFTILYEDSAGLMRLQVSLFLKVFALRIGIKGKCYVLRQVSSLKRRNDIPLNFLSLFKMQISTISIEIFSLILVRYQSIVKNISYFFNSVVVCVLTLLLNIQVCNIFHKKLVYCTFVYWLNLRIRHLTTEHYLTLSSGFM